MTENNYTYNLGQVFEKIISKKPENIAIITEDKNDNISFQNLNKLSNRIANFIISKGLKKNDVVAIFHDKSPTAYSLMIACLKIGLIYTCIDPNSPKIRLNKILKISSPKLIFSFKDLDHSDFEFVIYNHKDFVNNLSHFNSELPTENNYVNSNTPAYLMFTSGSTGFPKAVIISHQNIINFISWSRSTFQITNKDVLTSINPPYFDNSVFDFYCSLFNGASLISIDQKLLITAKKLIDYLNIKKPTILFSVPSMLVYMLNMRSITPSDLPSLKKIIFGGEGFPKNQLRKLWEIWGEKKSFYNVYGPTECTCICSSYLVKKQDLEINDLLPLGPIALNFEAIIIDENMKKVEDGKIGELLIGGPNVGIGYYNNSEKTRTSFIANPFNEQYDKKYYKSGDLVIYNKKSDLIFFKGRVDNQIKKMGHRIELEEIESALNSIKHIKECAVVSKNLDEKILIYACISAYQIREDQIIKQLKDSIPYYMMPDIFLKFDLLPKNSNGKIDKVKILKQINER